ncbi:hypothetical protein TNCV_994241 [Trichonephila clavipes]|nr:hypothetical protein TNCV_994241 [Trichonephila clavipes]
MLLPTFSHWKTRFSLSAPTISLALASRNSAHHQPPEGEKRNLSQQINYCIFDQVVMSILEKLAKISKMEVDPSDKNQSPCFQRHQILKKIEIEKMTLKTFKELHQKYQNSDPSLAGDY